jgi:LysM repeat protein
VRTSILAAAGLLALAAPLAAQTPGAAEAERVHVVRKGDTLWDIARQYLNDPFMWQEIFRLNASTIRNPHLIYPDEHVQLPGRLARVVAAAAADDAQARLGSTGYPMEEVRDRTVFYPQSEEAVDSHLIRRAGTADVPIFSPGEFRRAAILATEQEVPSLGRIVEVEQPSVVRLGIAPSAQMYDRVYVALAAAGGLALGDQVHFVRRDRRVRPFGFVWNPTGIGTVAAVDGATATVVIVQQFDEIRMGDIATPLAMFPIAAGVSPTPREGLDGRLVAIRGNNELPATYDQVFIDLGDGTGVRPGDEFMVYRPQERRSWGTRPPVEVARIQVLRVADRTATARVTDLSHPALEAGLPVRRVAGLP